MKSAKTAVSVCAVLIWSTAFAGQDHSPAPQSLRFAWPDVVALVDTDYLREISREQERRQVSHLHMTHRMRVLTLDDGRVVEYSDHKRIEASGDGLQAVNALLALWVPRSIVNADGFFLRIQGAAELRKLVAEMVEPQLRAAGQIPAFREYLEKMATEDGLRLTAATDWNLLVTTWIDVSLTAPSVLSEGTTPFPGGVAVPTKNAIGVVDRSKCTRDVQVRECVTVEHRSTIEAGQMAAALKALIGSGNTPAAGTPLDMDYERVVRVTMEAGTMLPHELTVTRRSTQHRDENGKRVALGDFERRQSRFVYEQTP